MPICHFYLWSSETEAVNGQMTPLGGIRFIIRTAYGFRFLGKLEIIDHLNSQPHLGCVSMSVCLSVTSLVVAILTQF